MKDHCKPNIVGYLAILSTIYVPYLSTKKFRWLEISLFELINSHYVKHIKKIQEDGRLCYWIYFSVGKSSSYHQLVNHTPEAFSLTLDSDLSKDLPLFEFSSLV